MANGVFFQLFHVQHVYCQFCLQSKFNILEITLNTIIYKPIKQFQSWDKQIVLPWQQNCSLETSTGNIIIITIIIIIDFI